MRQFLATVAMAVAMGAAGAATPVQGHGVTAAVSPPKVLRYAFRVAETGFDPAQVIDVYSRTVTPHIFEGLYGYDHLARPAKIEPLTAAAMPEVSDDFRTWTVRLRPGIFFQDDPAFGGRPRELVAADYVYSFKRFADPATKSPAWGSLQQQGIVGLAEQRERALTTKQPFDYDTPIAGLQALDRHTLRFQLAAPRPRFLETLATGDLFGAVAREVVERYGADIPAHPVGTGPFRLAQWRRSSLIVLERNPAYRERFYDAEPAADDAEGQALLARFQGRRLPMVDRVEISIIEEEQPRWLAFLQGQHDFIEQMPAAFIDLAMPGGEVAPHLARKGVRGWQAVRSDVFFVVFNMDDPVVGGLAPAQVALRRAIGLALDVPREIATVWRGQAIAAQSTLLPHTTGHDPALRSEMGVYDPARAKALLDLYGWTDRDGDGWRERPDGQPLVLEMLTQPDSQSRALDELRAKNLAAVGLRLRYRAQKWPENLKAARGGQYQLWRVGGSAAAPDGQPSLARFHGPQVGGQNIARFRLPAFDALYERMEVLPDGPERLDLMRQAQRLGMAYAPYKTLVHRVVTDLAQPALLGYRRTLFWQDWWHMVDIQTGPDSNTRTP
ncbi:ABC transporter substrate-binding protein [Rubrivivax albus]|uniref:Bicyclomycin resistance protein n=1 Tax=Rubrivivax albus TaxID=2499835 RepID=A0A437JMW5_9BURK|nr:ABC transporter substrate-binding protein [Rubrivivax albus]RVT48103.1 bicyclomycin resistance protein [Rubrivivax albus]